MDLGKSSAASGFATQRTSLLVSIVLKSLMHTQAKAQFFSGFEAVEDLFESALSIWARSDRVSAVQDILECNSQSNTVIGQLTTAL